MAAADVQKSCIAAFGHTSSKAAQSPHETLHAKMAQFRIANDTGMSVSDSIDTVAIRQHREQTRLRAILQLNAGSAMGMANPGELLFDEAIPPCPRWGDRVLQTYAARGFDHISMQRMGGVGADSRPSVPGPLQFSKAAQRVGPHGSPEALRQPELPICSYGQMVEEARAEAASAKPATATAAVVFGMELIEEEEEETDADGPTKSVRLDWEAAAQNGKRVWPPAAFQSSGAAKDALDVTRQIGTVITDLGVKDNVLSCVPKAYGATVEFVLSAEALTPASRDAYAALGLGALTGKRADVAEAANRAQVLAALAFATGNGDLGGALRDLATGPLERFARKTWKV